MLWSLSTTDRSMLVTATSVDTFTFSYMRENTTLRQVNQGSKIYHLQLVLRIQTPSHLNVIGNQAAIASHCDGKVVIAAGWLAGHEIQRKYATKSQKKMIKTQA